MKNKKINLDKIAGGQNIVTAKKDSDSTWQSVVDSVNKISNATSQVESLEANKAFKINDEKNEARKSSDLRNNFLGN